MSVCFESSNVLTNVVSTSSETSLEENVSNQAITSVTNLPTNIVHSLASNNVHSSEKPEQIISSTKSIAKLVVANAASTSSVLQKVVNPPLITVLNPSGPLTVVKTLCVTSGVSSAPQFTLVNSGPLNVTNAVGKSPTITLLNAPVTVVKAITTPQNVNVEKNLPEVINNAANPCNNTNNTSPVSTIIENRAHNVFVKNTCPDSTVGDMPQSHKILTANNFPQTNILTNPQSKTLNGQRNKLKIVSTNVVVPGTSQTTNNILVNKSNQRYIPRPKVLGPNSANTKYIPKANQSNFVKSGLNPQIKMVPSDKSPTRMVYPTHKGQIKTISPVNNYLQKHQHGIKTITPQGKSIPGQVTRTGTGLRTIPPQKAHKIPNKPNYIGKHAVQAQKMRQAHGKVKGLKVPSNVPYNVHVPPMPDKHLNELTFNQALTAQIIETLSNSSAAPLQNNRYDVMPSRYDNAFTCPEIKPTSEPCKSIEDTNKSGLDALSLICQAVLLDHNYNATLPPDSPTRPSPPLNIPTQVNGLSTPSIYSPGSSKRRPMPSSSMVTSPTLIPNMPLGPTNNSLIPVRDDDDAASDISDGSERKHDTEGEETDTAPEAEAVNNDNFEGYGDYVTRCICGFLHDDGYMVECDKCKVWQHVQCVVKNRQVPDEYLCEECDPSKPLDRQKARVLQQQWLRDRQVMDPKLRKEPKVKEVFKPKETISDSDSSDGEHVPNNFVPKPRVLANKRKIENHPKQTLARQRRENAKEVVQKRQKRKERKIIRKKTKVPVKNQSDDENQDTWAAHLPQLRQWIEKYEEAVTNHYSPELRARISSIRVNGAHSDSNIQFDSTVHKCRVHTQPLTEIKYLVATVNLSPNTPVVELRGKYMLSTQHRNSGGSLTTRQHSQRPGPFLFFYRLHKDNTEVCVDTRTYGNSARFIRRSCKPNAELRHCIEKGVLHIYVVSTASVDKNCELTIKHESHDLAAIGTTSIACACGNQEECAVNKSIKKNGETLEVPGRKRRRRRIVSSNPPEPDPPKPVKEPPTQPSPPPPPPIASPPPLPPPAPSPVKVKIENQEEVKKEEVEVEEQEIKEAIPEPPPIEIKEEAKVEVKVEVEETSNNVKPEVEEDSSPEENKDAKSDEKSQPDEVMKSPPPTPVATRRTSHKSDKEEEKSSPPKGDKKDKSKKLSREERKLEAILRAIEQMEKAESRKQEHQAKQAHRRESEPNPAHKEEEKQEPKLKRRRRKGRARTVSQSAARRNRLNSTDSYMTTSGEENLLSPNDNQLPPKPLSKDNDSNNDTRAVGLLLALSNGDNDAKEHKSPSRDMDSNSNSAHSSPETPLSSACLLVQAAVEPLEQGFKFPKTKKGLMNEWLNKVPEPVQTPSAISPTSIGSHNIVELDSPGMFGTKNVNLAQVMSYCDVNIQPRGSAKKRWLRQAISEDHSCDSPSSRPDSPPISDMVAPPKKRRLPRESISTDNSPPSTPTGPVPAIVNVSDKESKHPEGSVEIVYTGADGDSPNQILESDALLKERAAKMKQEFSKPLFSSTIEHSRPDLSTTISCMDPRLSRENRFLPNTDLVGTVEKTLSILGLENTETRKPEPITPKRKVKLSITEYRQRKKINVEEKSEELETELVSTEENNSSESFKTGPRPRSASASSSTSLTSSDDDVCTPEIVVKAPVFNSEPTELERQRETSSLRLKKAFGLSIDKEPPAALNIKALLNLEMESPKMKSASLQSPTVPIPGNNESTSKETESSPTAPADSPEPTAMRTESPPPPPPLEKPQAMMETSMEAMETEEISVTEDDVTSVVEEKETKETDDAPLNLFYTPDEEDAAANSAEKEEETTVNFEETESISYVPPFNNPIYPNSSFTGFSSTIDDDARYEGRNPSPPPNLDEFAQS